MAQKKPKKANGVPLATVIRESANQVWLAGLGAFAQAEEKGGDWFANLISAGEKLENAAREQVTRPIRVAERRVTETRDSIGDSWDAVVLVFERRLARLLHSFQVPTKRDIAELTRRVEELQATVRDMEQSNAALKPAPRRATRGTRVAKTKPARKKSGKATTAGRGRTHKASARSVARKAGASRQSRAGA